MAFSALKVALKVNYDLEFEITGLCSLCKSTLRYMYRVTKVVGDTDYVDIKTRVAPSI